MRPQLLLAALLLPACATTSGGSKGSTAPFQGLDAVSKRRNEVSDAASKVMDCMKVKAGEAVSRGGIFAVSADAAGKLTATQVRWEGTAEASQCILDKAKAAAITPLPGPAVGVLWEFLPPGEQPKTPQVPVELSTKVQSVQGSAQTEVEACAQQNLPPEFPADTEVNFYVDASGAVYVPTIIKSTAKDGGYDRCVQQVVAKTKFPPVAMETPAQLTFRFHVGRTEKL